MMGSAPVGIPAWMQLAVAVLGGFNVLDHIPVHDENRPGSLSLGSWPALGVEARPEHYLAKIKLTKSIVDAAKAQTNDVGCSGASVLEIMLMFCPARGSATASKPCQPWRHTLSVTMEVALRTRTCAEWCNSPSRFRTSRLS
ncbi:hypothetical protein CBM2605_U20003 [Cupriavidus neocaledonicus]|uniref:Uncharacterized protein n=1 Tax=Cupriavidus neocaledonicus TaxID=1040979 RepID=A0ABY1VE56_9BURK|nr:hypothetical protein CBM2605_U20003 [Cupriavidus neocaledonicus]